MEIVLTILFVLFIVFGPIICPALNDFETKKGEQRRIKKQIEEQRIKMPLYYSLLDRMNVDIQATQSETEFEEYMSTPFILSKKDRHKLISELYTNIFINMQFVEDELHLPGTNKKILFV